MSGRSPKKIEGYEANCKYNSSAIFNCESFSFDAHFLKLVLVICIITMNHTDADKNFNFPTLNEKSSYPLLRCRKYYFGVAYKFIIFVRLCLLHFLRRVNIHIGFVLVDP